MRVIDEFIAFSDLHAHNFPFGAKRVEHYDSKTFPGLYNSRLLDTVSVLRYIDEYARSQGIDTLVFGGDLFHRRSIQHTDVYNLVLRELYRMAEPRERTIIMIPGNHDYSDRLGQTHALQSIRHPRIHVGDTIQRFGSRTGFITVPFTDNLEEARRRLQEAGELADKQRGWPVVLLAHLGMQGAKVGSDYVLVDDNDVSVSDVPHEKFELCLFGHFHEHQRLFGNGWYIGATHQHNWGDSGGTRGFLHVQMLERGKVNFEHIPIPSAPRFIVAETQDELDAARAGDFVRYLVPVGDPCPHDVDPEFGSFEAIRRVDKSESRLTLTADQLDPERALAAWVAEHPHEALSSEVLLKKGSELLRKARGG